MKTTGLSLDQAPPISVPLRFFLAAPLFAFAAALVVFWQGPEALASRWSGPMLAVTHLFTLGFLAMVMVGALMQMLPVVAGSPVPKPVLVARVVHVPLMLGAALLPAGFLTGRALLFEGAMLALGVAFLGFLVALAYSVVRTRPANPTVIAMGLAGVALAVTVGLGLYLGSTHAGRVTLSIVALKNLHPAWGVLGWVSLLVIGVAYQVVPMFQITPPYAKRVTRWLAPALFAGLVAWSALTLAGLALEAVAATAIAASLVTFAVATLRIQRQRKRKQPDVTLSFWRLAMGCLIAAAVLWALGRLIPALSSPAFDLATGMLLVVGFAYSVVNGMLYKIVPFLVWFHLQSMSMGRIRVPNVKEVIRDTEARRQLRCHTGFVALALGAAVVPELLAYPAAATLALSAGMLGWNLLRALKLYRKHVEQLRGCEPVVLSTVGM